MKLEDIEDDDIETEAQKAKWLEDRDRLRIYQINGEDLVRWLSLPRHFKDGRIACSMPILPNIPLGAEFVAARDDIQTNGLCLLVRHSSFEKQPPGNVLPRYRVEWVVCGIKIELAELPTAEAIEQIESKPLRVRLRALAVINSKDTYERRQPDRKISCSRITSKTAPGPIQITARDGATRHVI